MMNISYLYHHHYFHPGPGGGAAYAMPSLPSPATPGDPSLFFVPSSASHSTPQASQITLPSSSSAFHTYYASPTSARSSFDASGSSSSSSGQVGFSLPSIMSGFPPYVDDSMSIVGVGGAMQDQPHHSTYSMAPPPQSFVQQQQAHQHQYLQYQYQQEQSAVSSMMADQYHKKIMTMLKVPDADAAAAATVAGPPIGMLPPFSYMYYYSSSMAPHLASQYHYQYLYMPTQGSMFDSAMMMNTGSCGGASSASSAVYQGIVDQQSSAAQHISMGTMDSSTLTFDEYATAITMADMNTTSSAAAIVTPAAAEPTYDARPTRRGKRSTVSASSTPSLGPEQSNASGQVRRRTAQNTYLLPRQCYNCSTTYTSQWRTDGYNRLCNKCGLYWERKGHMRPGPFDLTVKRRKRKKDGEDEDSPGLTGMSYYQYVSPQINATYSQSSVDTSSSQRSTTYQDTQTTAKRGKKRNTPPAASKGKASAKNKRKKPNSVSVPGSSIPLFGDEISAAEEVATAAAAPVAVTAMADATPTPAFVETFSHVSLDSQYPEFVNIKLEQPEHVQPVLYNMSSTNVPLMDPPTGYITLQLSKEEIQLALIALYCYQNYVPCPVPALLPSVEPIIMTDAAINSLVPLTMAMGGSSLPMQMHAPASYFAAQTDQHTSATGFR